MQLKQRPTATHCASDRPFRQSGSPDRHISASENNVCKDDRKKTSSHTDVFHLIIKNCANSPQHANTNAENAMSMYPLARSASCPCAAVVAFWEYVVFDGFVLLVVVEAVGFVAPYAVSDCMLQEQGSGEVVSDII